MKYKAFLLSIVVLYFLALFQTSFLVHFRILGYVPNLVLFFVVIWNLLEDGKNSTGGFVSLIGGFFLDVFSNHFIGFNILILVLISLAIKLILKKYVGLSFKS